MEAVQQFVSQLRDQVSTVVVGPGRHMLNQCLLGLLCKRTRVARRRARYRQNANRQDAGTRVLRLQFQRVQCTSDLMPADILGTNVLNMSNGSSQLHKGPIFTDLLLVDEVNRMPPRTQAALLELHAKNS